MAGRSSQWLIQNLVVLLLLTVLLFGGSGKWSWWYLVHLSTVAFHIAFQRLSVPAETRAVRVGMGSSTDKLDLALARIMIYSVLVREFMAGLDGRFEITQSCWFPPVVRVLGLAMSISGSVFQSWAIAVNRFFIPVVRVQEGHRVVDTGPYAIVRHPGYLGMICNAFGAPLVLGSWLAMLVVFLMFGATIWRASREDAFLQANLPGYKEYAQRVKSKLLPFIF